MSFNAVRENKILAKISVFTVHAHRFVEPLVYCHSFNNKRQDIGVFWLNT